MPSEDGRVPSVEGDLWEEDLGDVRLLFDGYWIWVVSKNGPPYAITGKYLFFSEDVDELRRIALVEIREHGFHEAKYNPVPSGTSGESVLCLYYRDDSRKYELAKRARAYRAKYRYWKSDEDTLKGRYSQEFLRGLTPKQRKAFTRGHRKDRDGAEPED